MALELDRIVRRHDVHLRVLAPVEFDEPAEIFASLPGIDLDQ